MSRTQTLQKVFGSDIFNCQKTEPAKRNTVRENVIGKNNDVFNLKDHPKFRRDLEREKKLDNAHDIFNRSYDFQTIPVLHKRDAITKGSDIFGEPKEQVIKVKRNRPVLNASDIFNQKGIAPRRTVRNHSQSDIFFTQGRNCPQIYPKIKKYQSTYDPNIYIKDVSAGNAKLKELYSSSLAPNKPFPIYTLGSSKGYCEKRELIDNTPNYRTLTPGVQTKNTFKKLKSPFEIKTGNKVMAHPREMFVSDMKSNIFNDREQERKNASLSPRPVPKPKKDTKDLTKPKKCRGNVKWVAKMDWKAPDSEIIFRTFNSKNNVENKEQTLNLGSLGFHHLRKKIDMADSFGPQPYNTHRELTHTNHTVNEDFKLEGINKIGVRTKAEKARYSKLVKKPERKFNQLKPKVPKKK